ncbi:hypothetical protein SRHO_G00165650 [Serrasalmus rhombeus]
MSSDTAGAELTSAGQAASLVDVDVACATGRIRDYIDECAEGLIQCHNGSRCVNLPGWYHCQCRSGFHDNGSYLLDGSSCVDVDECATQTHTCWNDSVCVNLPGAFDCVCIAGPECTGDCVQDDGLKHNGQEWSLGQDSCSVCTCKDGRVFCRRRECDCDDPAVDLFCCPECDTRQSSQCLHQSGHTLYRSGDSWVYNCQQCRCLVSPLIYTQHSDHGNKVRFSGRIRHGPPEIHSGTSCFTSFKSRLS